MSAFHSSRQDGDGDNDSTRKPKDLTTSDLIPLYPSNPPRLGVLRIRLDCTNNMHLSAEMLEVPSAGGLTKRPHNKRWRPLAVLEYDGFQVPAPAFLWTRTGIVWTETYKFDVTASSDLTIHLLAFGSSDPSQKPKCVPLTRLTVDPFLETWPSKDGASIDLPDNMGHLRLILSFHEEEVGASKMERMLDSLLNIQLDDFIWVTNKYADPNTRHLDRFYGMSTVHAVEFDGSSQTTSWKHPFIAPLKYAFESPAGLSLFSHFASSGHLFGHLQEERRFDIEKATFYAAELVSVLEFLHGQNIVNCLKLENITVDPFGHISICAPGLFALEVSPNKVRSMPGTPEFPAPELVQGNAASKVADWWTLGVFLYEMLTGLPPFYADEYEARKRNITNQDVQLPAEMKPAATDLLLRLLDKVPTRRLGANGVSDVKSHVLFDGIDWRQLQQKHPTSFIPDMISPVYYAKLEGPKIRQVPYTRNPTGRESNPTCRRLEKNGLLVDELSYDFWGSPITRWHELARVRGENTEHTNSQPPAPIPDVDGWKFAWDSDAQELRFENEVTNQDFCVKSPERELYDLAPIESDGTRVHEDSESLSHLFWREALRIALKSNHGTRVIKMILEQGNIDINKAILLYEEPVFTKYLPLEREEIPLNPLEWAVEHDRVDLFHLFLEAGADANKTSEAVKGPALMKAVRRENLHMVKVLAPLTGRVSCTRALGLAVDQQSAAVVEALLEARPPSHEGEHQHQHQQQQHVRSDFEDGDAP
ncbi:protein kinase [Apiospora kogelbergensis]|uniref:protein kinase n=1 Tax=Apiospora kogelbergensis TaxID=1337665 RepID=UPI003130D766